MPDGTNTSHVKTPAPLSRDLETLRLGPNDNGYDRGDPLLEVVRARTDVKDSTYISKMTGRTASRVRDAVEMIREELELLVEQGFTIQGLREHFGIEPSRGHRLRRKTANLPEVETLEAASQMPYDEPFVFSTHDVQTPTGKHYKPYQTVFRKLCSDGTDRIVHASDLHQLLDEKGNVRSHEQVQKRRMAHRKERRANKRKETRGKETASS